MSWKMKKMMMIKNQMMENKVFMIILIPFWIITELFETSLYLINKSEFKPSFERSFIFAMRNQNE